MKNAVKAGNGLEWLRLSLMKKGMPLKAGMDVKSLSDSSIPEIYERLDLIHTAYENRACEGCLMDIEIFNSLEDLGERISNNAPCRLSDIEDLIVKLGMRYGLYDQNVIDVTNP